MKGLRLYGISKSLQRYISAADPAASELLDESPSITAPDQPHLSAVAQWFDDSQEYRFAV
jgi:hypothetical protein